MELIDFPTIAQTSMAKSSLILTAEALRRRSLLTQAGTLGVASAFGNPVLSALAAEAGHVTPPFENGERALVAYPKRPLILLTARPPCGSAPP